MKHFISVSVASDPWYVVHCKPRREFYAASLLSNNLGITTYLPEIEIHLRKRMQRIPFFPGYFFIQANLQRVGVSRINSSPGILRLLDFGNGPLDVPQILIETIREEMNQHSIHNNISYQRLCAGDHVQVTNGPFEGLRAIFIQPLTSDERAQILLHFLGRLSKVQVDMDSLKKLKDRPSEELSNGSSRRERRTRGKGRRINRTAHKAYGE